MFVNALVSTSLLLLSPGGVLACPTGVGQSPVPPIHALSIESDARTIDVGGEHNTWVWSHSDNGVTLVVRVEGEVAFAEDYSDVMSISDDGYFMAQDERGGMRRKLRVEQDADNHLRRSYTVNGRAREFDAEARAWLSSLLLRAVREGGLNAEARARSILRRSGARGLLEEVTLLANDYARRIYFEMLIKDGGADTATLQTALRYASRQITSDYELAQLLIGFARAYLSEDMLIDDFFAATRKMKSDYEHHRVLSAVLKAKPGHQALSKMLESAAVISSDYEKATFLIEAAPFYLDDASLRAAFFETIKSIASDYERGRVLAVMSKKNQLGSGLD